jgi:hypothetical protein
MKQICAISLILLWCTAGLAQDFEIFVSDAGNFNNPPWQILKFDGNGENPQVFTDTNLGWPQDILFLDDQNVVLISNLNTNQINRHDAQSGAFVDIFAADISGPTRMKIGPDNLIYALQWTGNGRVKRYQLDGTPMGDFTNLSVSQSIGLDWDNSGNLYVSSFAQGNVRRFDSQGNDQGVFVSSNLQGPTNIWFDDAGDLLVNDWSGNRVQRFDSSGNFISTFISSIPQPEGIGFLPNGNLLLGTGSRTVREYTPSGDLVGDRVTAFTSGLIQANAVVVRPLASGSDFQINAGITGAWFDPGTAGQGFLIDIEPDSEFMFIAWFTYEQASSKVGAPEHRWLTAQGNYSGGTGNLDLFNTTGGQFDDPQMTTTVSAGTLTVTFTDCSNGTIDYDLPGDGVEGSISIVRVIPGTESLCEAQ